MMRSRAYVAATMVDARLAPNKDDAHRPDTPESPQASTTALLWRWYMYPQIPMVHVPSDTTKKREGELIELTESNIIAGSSHRIDYGCIT